MRTITITPKIRELASGLQFPEGPIAMPDGSIILVEIARRTLTRVGVDGKTRVIAALGGRPNGAAMGPGGKIYVMSLEPTQPRWLEKQLGSERYERLIALKAKWDPDHLLNPGLVPQSP